MILPRPIIAMLVLALAGCQAADEPAAEPVGSETAVAAGDSSAPDEAQPIGTDEEDVETFQGIATSEMVRFTGTALYLAEKKHFESLV